MNDGPDVSPLPPERAADPTPAPAPSAAKELLTGRRGPVVVVVLLAVAATVLFAGGGAGVGRGAALFCLAAIGGVLATRRIGRRLVGVAVVLVGGLAVVASHLWLVRLSGLLMVAAGVLVTWLGPRWAGLSSRYQGAGEGGPAPGQDAGPPEPGGSGRPQDLWDALDRGEDPTA